MATGVALVVGLPGCADGGGEEAETAPDFLVERLGGDTSAREFRGRPFNQSARNITNDELARFGDGALVFDEHFDVDDGLGPVFNDDSCLSCHLDGNTIISFEPDDPGPGLLLRLSVPGPTPTGAPRIEPTYGLQLQDRAEGDGRPEGRIEIEWDLIEGEYPDGTTYQLRAPTYDVVDLSDGPLADDVMMSARIAPPMVGLGLLEAIAAADLLAAADPDDADGDGISGRVNMVWDQLGRRTVIGRFGWKAGQPTVRQQSAGALHDDMGITSPDLPDPCAGQGSACALPATPPEMSATDLADQVFYNRTIAVPIARDVDSPEVIAGANRFVDTGCASCHTTTQRSGHDEVAALSDQTFHPFTDLLLHDMGDGLADGRGEFLASGSEWRTPPLWGLSRREEVTGFSSYLHDGRARTIEEAILWHGGEARAARDRFVELEVEDRSDLLAFLGAI